MGKATAAKLDRATLSAIPRSIWVLGIVSMLMDVSSEMIHGLLPVYLVTVLGASAQTVGVIEGVAEATASVTKVFSGAISDWLGKRKWLTALGYGLAAFTKPIFPLANGIGWLVAARFIDRVGKGIRGAPRDALIADIAPPELRGASFGLRQSLDTVGAVVGPLLAVVLMLALSGDIKAVFWIAVIPAFLSMLLIIFGVSEPDSKTAARPARFPLHMDEFRKLPLVYWYVVAIAMVFTLARFSEAFLILRAQSAGVSNVYVPIVLVVMNIAYAAAAYPAGVMSDNGGRMKLLMIGLVLLIAADLVLAAVPGLSGIAMGVVLWGLHMAFSQGLFAALVADTSPPELRGTAFGLFNLLTGLSLLAASVVAGMLWDRFGPQTTFLAGAAFAGLAFAGLLLTRATLAPK